MQIYCGTDIIEVSRIEDAINNTKGFKENVFTKAEIGDIDTIKSQIKYQRYAGRFAAKEAVYKAMSKVLIENRLSIGFVDVEILNIGELNRRPAVNFLNEEVENLCKKMDITIDVSISHIKEYAVATVVVNVDC